MLYLGLFKLFMAWCLSCFVAVFGFVLLLRSCLDLRAWWGRLGKPAGSMCLLAEGEGCLTQEDWRLGGTRQPSVPHGIFCVKPT